MSYANNYFSMRRLIAKRLLLHRLLLVICWPTLTALAYSEEFGLFTYILSDNQVSIVITDYPIEAEGSVTIPSEIDGKLVTEIGERAFASCSKLTSISLPKTLNSIGSDAFLGCRSLTSISTMPGSVSYESIDGVLFSNTPGPGSVSYEIDGVLFTTNIVLHLVRYPEGKIADEYTVPATTEVISFGAFKDVTALSRINLPPAISSIQGAAFSGCSNLREINIPEALTRLGAVFQNCTSLSNIIIPEGVRSIGTEAFLGCSNLATISLPNTLIFLRSDAFAGCSSLTQLHLPAGLTDIEGFTWNSSNNHPFSRCENLHSLTVDPSNERYHSIDGVLFNIDCSQIFLYPPGRVEATYEIPDSVTSIGRKAFHHCGSLVEITLPENIVYLSTSEPFDFCDNLNSISIGANVARVSETIFSNLSNLQSINVASENPYFFDIDGVLFSNAGTFPGSPDPPSPNRQLISYPRGRVGPYTVPYGTESIFGYALGEALYTRTRGPFNGSDHLTTLTIPASVTDIEAGSLSECPNLEAIHVLQGNPTYSSHEGVLFDASRTTLIRFPEGKAGNYAIPDGTASTTGPLFLGWEGNTLGVPAFLNCRKLTSLTVPESLISPDVRSMPWEYNDYMSLKSVIFTGNATEHVSDLLSSLREKPTVYFHRGATGFTEPEWRGYPSVMIDVDTHPAATWLIRNNLFHDTDLKSDHNGDGTSLLLSYALNLDPVHPEPGMPRPEIDPNTGDLSLFYQSDQPGVSYRVETSLDLTDWTTGGVTISEPDELNRRAASTPNNGSKRYMRVVVQEN